MVLRTLLLENSRRMGSWRWVICGMMADGRPTGSSLAFNLLDFRCLPFLQCTLLARNIFPCSAFGMGVGGRRERATYIFPWLQVHVTGPRRHMASSPLGVGARAPQLERKDVTGSGGAIWHGPDCWKGGSAPQVSIPRCCNLTVVRRPPL